MAKKHKGSEQEEKQLLLFARQNDLNPEQSDDSDDDWLQDDLGFDFEPSDHTVEPQARELLTLKLLREAIQTQNPDEQVMSDFAEYVLPNLPR